MLVQVAAITISIPPMNRLHANLYILIAMAAFRNMQFINSIWLVYLESHKQVGPELFIVIEGLFALAMAVMEVPSGWLSDRFKRTTVLRVAEVLAAASMASLLLLDGLVSVILAQALLGIGFSFSSGTHQAAFYESLHTLGRKAEYAKWEARSSLTGNISLATATLLGSWLYLQHPQAPVALFGGALLLGVAASWLLVEPKRPRTTHSHHILHDLQVVFHSCFRRTVRLKAYLFINALLFATLNVLYWMQQPYLQHAGVPVAWFGPVLFADSLMAGIGGWLAAKVAFRQPRHGIGLAAAAVVGLLAMVALVPVGWAGVGVFFALSLVWGYGEVLVAERLQHLALPHMRATVLSMASLMRQGWFFLFSLIAAQLLGYGGLALVYAGAALLLALALPICLRLLYGHDWLQEKTLETVTLPATQPR